MMTLYEEGEWQLDDPVTAFIREFADLQVLQDARLVPLDRPMTMRHLMATCAGFAFLVPMGSTNPKVDQMYAAADLFGGTNEDMVAKLAKLPLEAQPGALFRYGLQQEVQGVIIQRLSGQSLDVFLNSRIFAPLGMTDTGFGVAPEQRDRIAPRYATGREPEARACRRPITVPGAGRHSRGGEAQVFAVDRRPVLDRAGLPSLRADAGQRRTSGRSKDFGAILGHPDDKQPAPRGCADAILTAVYWRWLRYGDGHRARTGTR
ncbi:serine hydrolase domain-containing protein [Mycobacterium sp.]|uniref:serine hydrolase domain-containing protein n=1 Tax=Mycobacterium sp. TaxID=1785 RepID=UPI0039C95BC7